MPLIRKYYYLFEIEKLSEIERNIILFLGEVINEKGIFPKPKVTEERILINLINRIGKYDREELFKCLSLLCLRNLIAIEDVKHKRKIREDEGRKSNINPLDKLDFAELIYNSLFENIHLIKDKEKAFFTRDVNREDINNITNKIDEKNIINKKIKSKLDEANMYFELLQSPNAEFESEISEELNTTIKSIYLYYELSNINHSSEDMLLGVVNKYFDFDKVINLNNLIFLTSHNKGFSGIQVYYYISRMDIIDQLKKSKDYLDQIEDKNKDLIQKIKDIEFIEESVRDEISYLDKQVKIELPETINKLKKEANENLDNEIKSNLRKNIEILTIFVAVITLIIGNISFIPQISSGTALGFIGLIMTINGCMLTGTFTLIYVISKLVTVEIKLKKRFWVSLILVLGLLLGGGSGFTIWDKLSIKAEVKVESSSPDIQNGLTIENNINATNEGAQPTVTISPEVSITVQPTPTPAPTPIS